MNNPPQAVTERYVSNLLNHGENNDFRFIALETHTTMAEGESIGWHYKLFLRSVANNEVEVGYGDTPSFALRRALEKFGVTFR